MLENHSSISSITLILTGKWPAQIKLFLKWKGIISGKIKVASKAQVRRGRLHQTEVLAEALTLEGRVISMLSLRMKVASTISRSDPKEVESKVVRVGPRILFRFFIYDERFWCQYSQVCPWQHLIFIWERLHKENWTKKGYSKMRIWFLSYFLGKAQPRIEATLKSAADSMVLLHSYWNYYDRWCLEQLLNVFDKDFID